MARAGLFDHRKFKRMVYMLAEPVPHCVGYLECLWTVGYQQRDDYIGDALDVALACQYPGEPEKIVAALHQGGAGFIDKIDEAAFRIHDLFDHAPDYVRKAITRQKAPNGAERRTTAENGGHCPAREEKGREGKRREEPPNPQRGNDQQAAPSANGSTKTTAEATTYPAALDTPAFRRSWSEWIDYRRERRLSLRGATLARQLAFLAPFGDRAACEAIEQSIRNDWKGLFPPKGKKGQDVGMFDGLKEFALKGSEDDPP